MPFASTVWASKPFLSRRRRSSERAENFIESFQALSLAPKESEDSGPRRTNEPNHDPPARRVVSLGNQLPAPVAHSSPTLVGRFDPESLAHPQQSNHLSFANHDARGPPSVPITFVPQLLTAPNRRTSLTMHYALDPPSTPPRTPPRPAMQALPTPDVLPLRPTSVSAFRATFQPVTPPTRRATSVPATPSAHSAEAATQCCGRKKNGERCTRKVKAIPAALMFRPDFDEHIERYCHQHRPEILKQNVFRSSNDEYLNFGDYIPDYLNDTTKAALRIDMTRSLSDKDEPGFIYAFEIIDLKNPHLLLIKVGRAKLLKKRLGEWDKQCASKEQILRGWWPDGLHCDSAELMKGRVQTREGGKCSHRLERLIHLELADLAMSKVYLESAWPNLHQDDSDSSASNGSSSPSSSPRKGMNGTRCNDCGKMHKEIFTFTRFTKGLHRGKEWEKVIRPVIEKWGGYVEAHL